MAAEKPTKGTHREDSSSNNNSTITATATTTTISSVSPC
jgi:hypothetical protein